MALQIPGITPQKQLKLATVPAQDEDELVQAIQNDPLGGGDDNSWDLTDDIDPARIEAFLDDALKEMGAEAPEK